MNSAVIPIDCLSSVGLVSANSITWRVPWIQYVRLWWNKCAEVQKDISCKMNITIMVSFFHWYPPRDVNLCCRGVAPSVHLGNTVSGNIPNQIFSSQFTIWIINNVNMTLYHMMDLVPTGFQILEVPREYKKVNCCEPLADFYCDTY